MPVDMVTSASGSEAPPNSVTIAIRYQDAVVHVRTSEIEVAEALVHRFPYLVSPEVDNPTAVFEMHAGVDDRYELRWDGRLITRREDLSSLIHKLIYNLVDALILGNRDLLWMHAGGAATDDRCFLFVGSFGSGKSTNVTQLVRRGWQLLADDVVPLDMRTTEAFAFQRTPWIRRPIDQQLPADRISQLRKKFIRIEREGFAERPHRLTGIVLPRYEHGAPATLTPCAPAEAMRLMIENCINFRFHPEAALSFFERLIHELPLLSLTFSDPEPVHDMLMSYPDSPIHGSPETRNSTDDRLPVRD